MKQISILIAFLIIGTTLISCNKTLKEEAKVVSVKEMQTLLQSDDVQLIDVRTPKEFKEDHIENAKNIDFLAPDFTKQISKLNKEKPIIVYCHSGARSAKSVEKLLEAGFTEIYDLQGGITKWKQEGFKVKINP